MFVHVAEVMGRHYGMVPIQVRCQFLDPSLRRRRPVPRLLVSGPLLFQRLDLLVRDSFHPSKAGQGHVGDVLQVSVQRERCGVGGGQVEVRDPVGKLGMGMDC